MNNINITKKIKRSIFNILNENFGSLRKDFSDIRELYDLYQEYGDYLLIGDNYKFNFFPTLGKPIPSHYIRSLLCSHLDLEKKSDWENIEDYTSFINNFKYLKGALQ